MTSKNLNESLDKELLRRLCLRDGQLNLNLYRDLEIRLGGVSMGRNRSFDVEDRDVLALYRRNKDYERFPKEFYDRNMPRKAFRVLERYLLKKDLIADAP